MIAAHRHGRASWLTGAVAALLTLVAGGSLALSRPAPWSAEATLVVLPSAALTPADRASYFETLSRGQMVATFAEVATNRQFEQAAEDALGLPQDLRETSSVTVTVVPSTAVVLVTARSTNQRVAEELADGAAQQAADYFTPLAQPFETDVVDSAAGTAYRAGTSPLVLLAAVFLLSLLAGFLVRQAVLSWPSGPRRSLPHRPITPPADGTIDAVNGTSPPQVTTPASRS